MAFISPTVILRTTTLHRTQLHGMPLHRRHVLISKRPVPNRNLTDAIIKAEQKQAPSNEQDLGQEDQQQFTERVRSQLAQEGINFEDLMDAPKTLALTRTLDELENALQNLPATEATAFQRERLTAEIEKTREKLSVLRRQVMLPALKQVFVVQAIITALAGGALASNHVPNVDIPLVGQAFGFWSVWLFSIPALRARKGLAKWEKSALNIAFVLTPLFNVFLPIVTKDCTVIWAVDVATLLGSYAFYLQKTLNSTDTGSQKEQAKVKGILKYLDWGSWR